MPLLPWQSLPGFVALCVVSIRLFLPATGSPSPTTCIEVGHHRESFILIKRKSAGPSLSLSHSISASSGQSPGGNQPAYWTGRAPTGNKVPIFPSCRDPSLKTDSLGASSLGLEGRKGSPPHPKPASFRLVLPLNSRGKWDDGILNFGDPAGPRGALCAQRRGLGAFYISSGSEPWFPDNGRAHLTSLYYQINPSLMLREDRGPAQCRRCWMGGLVFA